MDKENCIFCFGYYAISDLNSDNVLKIDKKDFPICAMHKNEIMSMIASGKL